MNQNPVARIWQQVLEIGVTSHLPASDARHVRITNAIAFSSALLSLSYLPSTWYLFKDHALLWMAMASIAGLNICYAFVLWLNHKGQYWLAPTLLAGLVWIHVFVTTFNAGSDTGIHLYFMAYALGTTLLFPPQYPKTRISFLTLGILSLALAETIAPETPGLGLKLPAFVLQFQSAFILCGIYVTVAVLAIYYDREMHTYESLLDTERAKADHLLLNILPASIADRLKQSEEAIADKFDEVTVLFADLVGFTVLSDKYSDTPEVVVSMLNELFRTIDNYVEELGCEKIKTIGDAYMVAAGIPDPNPHHAQVIVQLAQKMIEATSTIKTPAGEPLDMRIGIHTGPAVAGVIGSRKFAYDLWGDTVNIASRMESHGQPGRIHISTATWQAIKDDIPCEARGEIDVKGKGSMRTYFVNP